MFLILLGLLAVTLAEPPVGDTYAAARSNHNHDHQRSLSQEYGPPSARSFGSSLNSLSQGYAAPNAVARKPSQEYGTPGLRNGISQEYGTPGLRNGISQEYGAPSGRSGISTTYGAPSNRKSSPLARLYKARSAAFHPGNGYPEAGLRSGFSGQYGTPNLRDVPSDTYGAPEFRSVPSEEYGIPSHRNFGFHPKGVSPVQKYGVPEFRNPNTYADTYAGYEVASARVSSAQNSLAVDAYKSSSTSPQLRNTPESYGAGTRSLSSQYGVPEARTTDSYSQVDFSSSNTYGVPNGRSISQSYGAPSSRNADLRTNAYTTARSSPSQEYGPPSARSMPSQQYGVPSQYDALSDQGYGYTRNALEELLNQEPANYEFAYKVSDHGSGSDFGHVESRQDGKAEGWYSVVLPDGTKQVVEYEADENGFKPRISVEPADTEYDQAQGPY